MKLLLPLLIAFTGFLFFGVALLQEGGFVEQTAKVIAALYMSAASVYAWVYG